METIMIIYLNCLNVIIIEITQHKQFYIALNVINIYAVIVLIIIMKYFKEKNI